MYIGVASTGRALANTAILRRSVGETSGSERVSFSNKIIEINEPAVQRELTIIQMNTFYPRFLNELYMRVQNLEERPFEEQISIILKQGFSAIHNFVPHIDKLGYSSHFIVANNPYSQLKWAEENGIDSDPYRNRLDEILKIQIETIKPDVLLMSDAFEYDSRFIQRLSVRAPIIAGWSGEYVPEQVAWSGYDIILSNFRYVLKQALTKGARTAQFFHPGFLKWLYDEVCETVPQYDVVFVGQWSRLHQLRNELLSEVAKESHRSGKFSLALYLSGNTDEMPPEVRACCRGERFGLAMHRALRSGRIALNAETTPNLQIVKEAGNMRMFETTGTGVFLLTQHHDNISDYFIPGHEIETFHDKTELIRKIYYYLSQKEKRDSIARRGQERCFREYSMEGQLEKLDRIFRTSLAEKESSKRASGRGRSGYKMGIDALHKVGEHEMVHINVPTENLEVIKNIAEKQRFGNWCVSCFGLKIFCHDLLSFYHSAKNIFVRGIYDFETENREPLIIDGGGHIGLFTLRAKQRYPKSRVISFEPDSISLERFEQNIEANSFSGIRVVKAGLHKYDGQISFSTDHSDASSILAGEDGNSIAVVRLSKFINCEVDFLKLNIEGSELDVISEVAEKLPLIKELVIEYHGFPETGQRLHNILEILDKAGFRYLIHDFDASEQPGTKPPFRIQQDTRFYLLVYARRLSHGSLANGPFDRNRADIETNSSSRSVRATLPSEEIEFEGSDSTGNRRSSPGNIDRVRPVSSMFGCDRGTPIDRYYIDKFVQANRSYITGHVLEIGDDSYTRRYGEGVLKTDILNYCPSPTATIVGDLTTGQNIPVSAFDCIIMTQTLQFIYDLRSAIKTAFSSLKPNGTALLTTSALSQISRYDMRRWGDYWRVTDRCMRMLLEEVFDVERIYVNSHGNVAVAKAFLDGFALHEIDPRILDYCDNDYQIVVTAAAIK